MSTRRCRDVQKASISIKEGRDPKRPAGFEQTESTSFSTPPKTKRPMNEVVTGRGTHVGRVGVYLQSSKDDTVDGGEVHVPQQLRLLPQGHDALGFDGTHDVRYLKVEKRKLFRINRRWMFAVDLTISISNILNSMCLCLVRVNQNYYIIIILQATGFMNE